MVEYMYGVAGRLKRANDEVCNLRDKLKSKKSEALSLFMDIVDTLRVYGQDDQELKQKMNTLLGGPANVEPVVYGDKRIQIGMRQYHDPRPSHVNFRPTTILIVMLTEPQEVVFSATRDENSSSFPQVEILLHGRWENYISNYLEQAELLESEAMASSIRNELSVLESSIDDLKYFSGHRSS